jgi:SAM-dependent methyltransferase
LAGWLHRWLAPMVDPVAAWHAVLAYPWFLRDWRAYARSPGAEPIHPGDAYPQLHDRSPHHPYDPHYFYLNGWAMRRVAGCAPARHVDVASQAILANLLAAIVPVIFVDYRPLRVRLGGLHCVAASLLHLPFADGSIPSLSCLHVVEHVGLGRYGDPLDPDGTRAALAELARVLAPAGHLLLAAPVGRSRVCFNAHRIHTAQAIRAMLPQLELKEYSGVDDAGAYQERLDLDGLDSSEYACGLFWFRKPA